MSGRSTTWVDCRTWLMSERSVCSVTLAALTVTLSWTCETDNVESTRNVVFCEMVTPSTTRVEKDGAEIDTRYAPGWRSLKKYEPRSSETAVLRMPVPTFSTSTFAFGTAAPL